MKKGDKFTVVLGTHEVAEATLVEIDGDNAILEIPATRIVMGIHSSLGDLPEDPNAKERLLLGPEESTGDPVADELRAAGIELDDEPDYVEGRAPASGGEAQSLKDMSLDGLD